MAKPKTDRTELTQKVMELHRQVNRNLGRYTHEGWMDMNLTIAQLKALLFVAGEKQTNLSNLANALRVSPSNVTGIVDRLVEQELITRQGCHDDRRVLLLGTTEKGEAVVAKVRERRVGHMSQILSSVTEEELSVLAEAFITLLRAADEYEKRLTK